MKIKIFENIFFDTSRYVLHRSRTDKRPVIPYANQVYRKVFFIIPNSVYADILICFCNYYLNEEPQNCFVAVNDNDDVIGYVLCATNYEMWKSLFIEKYINTSQNPIAVQMANGTLKCLQPFSKDYPAHLHIDISQNSQCQGIGTSLLNSLKEHLRKTDIHGLVLDVAADNEGAIRFYKRNGFKFLSSSNQECIMGITI